MDSDLDSLGATIGAIGKPRFYPAMAHFLRRCIAYDNVIVIVFQGTATPAVLYREIHGPDVFSYLDEQYLPAAYLLDPIYHYHLNRGAAGLYRLLDVAPDQFRRSRYYKWYYGKIGITDEISVILPIGDKTTLTISMGKDISSDRIFTPKAEENLRRYESVIMALLNAHLAAAQETQAPARTPAQSITDSLIAAMRSLHNVTLSRRQAEVALLILQGHSSPSIGLHLDISPQTVKVFRKQLYGKCNLSSQAELFALMMPLLEYAQKAAQKSAT